MKSIKISLVAIVLLVSNQFFSQIIGGNKGGTTVEVDEKAAFDAQIQKNREDARAALKPYKYDGTKTTTYSYKTYTYAKEVEVLTIENTDYMLSFNANSVTKEKITVRIYDGPETAPGRILLYENTNVNANNFVVRIDELNQKFREERLKAFNAKPKAGQAPDAAEKAAANIAKMRLKKVYISYVIPAVDKEVASEQVSKNKTVNTTVVTFNAIVVAVGYKTL
jgi:hypothetical protein